MCKSTLTALLPHPILVILMTIFVEVPNITKEFYSFLQFLQLQCMSFSFRKLLSLRYSWTKGLPKGGSGGVRLLLSSLGWGVGGTQSDIQFLNQGVNLFWLQHFKM